MYFCFALFALTVAAGLKESVNTAWQRKTKRKGPRNAADNPLLLAGIGELVG